MKKYIRTGDKVLLDTDRFNWGTMMIMRDSLSLNLIEVSEEDAEYYYNKYQEAIRSREETVEKQTEEQPVLRKGAKSTPIDPLASVRESYLEELAAKGYNITKHVEPIINESNK